MAVISHVVSDYCLKLAIGLIDWNSVIFLDFSVCVFYSRNCVFCVFFYSTQHPDVFEKVIVLVFCSFSYFIFCNSRLYTVHIAAIPSSKSTFGTDFLCVGHAE